MKSEFPGLMDNLARAREAHAAANKMDYTAAADRLMEASHHIAVSNPEWREIVKGLQKELKEANGLLAHFRQCADSGLMKNVGHSELAGEVRMLLRSDLKHEVIVTAARDRILFLARQVALREIALGVARMAIEQGVGLEGHVAANGPTVREVLDYGNGKHDDRCAFRKGHPCNCALAAFKAG